MGYQNIVHGDNERDNMDVYDDSYAAIYVDIYDANYDVKGTTISFTSKWLVQIAHYAVRHTRISAHIDKLILST